MVAGIGRKGMMGGLGMVGLAGLMGATVRGMTRHAGVIDQAEMSNERATVLEASNGARVLVVDHESGTLANEELLARLCEERPDLRTISITREEFDELRGAERILNLGDNLLDDINLLEGGPIENRVQQPSKAEQTDRLQRELLAKLKALPIADMTQEQARAAVEEIRQQYAPVLNLEAHGTRPADYAALDAAAARRAERNAKRLRRAKHGA